MAMDREYNFKFTNQIQLNFVALLVLSRRYRYALIPLGLRISKTYAGIISDRFGGFRFVFRHVRCALNNILF
jgi:hypothetical protein